MQNANPTHHAAMRMLARVLTWALVAGQVMQPVYAVLTPLGDVPIAAKVAAKPNIVYTLDDSGSMLSNFIPDFVTSGQYPAFCRAYPTVSAGAPSYPKDPTSTYNNAMVACDAGTLTAFNSPPFYGSQFNHLAYNPDVTYSPPLKADGTPLTYNIGTITDAAGNQISLKTVQRDPYLSVATTDDLSVSVSVPIYCNSDWPLIGTKPATYDNKSDIGSVVLGDVGDVVGEDPTLNSQFGEHCRINGTPYAAAATSGAPAIAGDYNYPWPKVGATAGAPGSANDRAYFWRSSGVRQLWCNAAAAGAPQSCTAKWKCSMGGQVKYPLAEPQTCYFNSDIIGCTGPTTYSPAGCNTDPTYDLGGCIGAECQKCTSIACPTGVTGEQGNCHLTASGGPPGSGGSGASCSCVGAGCTLPQNCPTFQSQTPNGCTKGTLSLTTSCGPAALQCDSFVFDPVLLKNTPTTLLQDSNLANGGTGAVCRHNNFDYKDGKGGLPDTYPVAPFNTPVNANCPTIPTTATIPRHYYTVDSVQFCDKPDGTANAQWNGFGTGVCQFKNDFSKQKYVKYGQFHRTDLVNDGRTFSYNDLIAGPSTRTYAEEVINYANWYAYYRTRILAAKTTSSIAFSYLDNTYRVGFHNLGTSSSPPPIWVDVKDFDTAQKTAWYNSLFGIAASYRTFTMDAMLRIGNLFERGTNASLPASVNPLPATAKDPIQYSCQNNYHILFTDGFTNQPVTPVYVNERDATVPGAFPPPYAATDTLPQLKALLGAPWPTPFVQQTKAVPDTLSDIATYYWATDLRDAANPRSKNSLKNDVPAGLGTSVLQDLDWTNDPAWWQHVSFSAISFGSEGILDASNPNATVACIKAGTVSAVPGSPCEKVALSWSDLTNPNSPTYPIANKGAAGVDDLWHATVNSRGSFVYAKSPVEVANGLASILAGISNQRKSRSGAAFNGQVLDANNNVIFEPTIEKHWAGDLLKVEIDPATGSPVSLPVNGIWWQASVELAKQIDPSLTGDVEPWMNEKFRRIVTFNGSVGVPFLWAKLTAAQLKSLSPNPLIQKEMIAYLRGGNTYNKGAVVIEGTKPGQFRQRFGALGDLSNAQPVIIGPPDRNYLDTTDPGYGAPTCANCAASGFVAAKAGRPTVIVAPANDGMVHVIDAGPMPKSASAGNPAVKVSAGGGSEIFAFIPRALFRGVAGSAATEDATALQALTYQDGSAPIYHHHMYVDSSPRAADVDFNNGVGVPDWHSIIVGGLGKGGNSYYALDLSDVAVADEATAAAKVVWEWAIPFGTDSDAAVGAKLDPAGSPGYTYGRPVIVKVRESGYPTGRWVVIVTAGYNNLSGKGTVFFLDAATGKMLSTIRTSVGSTADPSGLAQIHAFVKNQNNQVAEQIYGGDLKGNVWRIDVSGTDSYLTAPAALFAQLTDPSGVGQPITTAPQIEIDLNNGIDRYVFFGTGRLLHPDDLTDPPVPQQQTFYAIRDGTLTAIETTGLPIQPRVTLAPINADGVSGIVGGAPNGWYQDLPNNLADAVNGAQRIVVDVQSNDNIAAYVGTKIQDDPCLISLPAFLYARDYTTGSSLLENSGGSIIPSLEFPGGGVGVQIVGRVQADGSLSLGAIISGEIPGTTPVNIKNPVTGPGIRWSWRLLSGQ